VDGDGAFDEVEALKDEIELLIKLDKCIGAVHGEFALSAGDADEAWSTLEELPTAALTVAARLKILIRMRAHTRASEIRRRTGGS